jgi:hypothetical protein
MGEKYHSREKGGMKGFLSSFNFVLSLKTMGETINHYHHKMP